MVESGKGQALAPGNGRVGYSRFEDLRHLGALDGYWRVPRDRPQVAGVRDRGGGGGTEARTFSHEWAAGCEGAEEQQGERLGKAARGVEQA